MINLFSNTPSESKEEHFETLLQTRKVHIEKITSYGYHTDKWYEQRRDEWVVLIEGEGHLLFENGQKVKLMKGEHIFIPQMQKHQVTFTTENTIWLAIHFD